MSSRRLVSSKFVRSGRVCNASGFDCGAGVCAIGTLTASVVIVK